MFNPISVTWPYITNLFGKRTSHVLWKLFFTTIFLIVTIVYYVEIQEVPHLLTAINCENIYPSESGELSADVNITYNFGDDRNNQELFQLDKPGIYITYLDSVQPLYTNPEYGGLVAPYSIFGANAKNCELVTWTNASYRNVCDSVLIHLIDSLINDAKVNGDEYTKCIADSVNSIDYFEISTTRMKTPFAWWILKNSTLRKWKYGVDTYHYCQSNRASGSYLNQCGVDLFDYNKQIHDANFSKWKIYNFMYIKGDTATVRIRSDIERNQVRNSIFSSQDISRTLVTFRRTGFMGLKSLKFNFIGATEFSDMVPEPDIRDYNSITFTNPSKLHKIGVHGLTFHAKFPDMENIQQTRNFVVTMVLTMLISIFFKLLYDISKDWVQRKCYKHLTLTKALLIFFAAVALVSAILYIFRPWTI